MMFHRLLGVVEHIDRLKAAIAGDSFCCLLPKPILEKDWCQKRRLLTSEQTCSPHTRRIVVFQSTFTLHLESRHLIDWRYFVFPSSDKSSGANTDSCTYLTCPAVPFNRIYIPSPEGVISHHSAGAGDRRAEEAHAHTPLLMAGLIAGSKLKWGDNVTCWPDWD